MAPIGDLIYSAGVCFIVGGERQIAATALRVDHEARQAVPTG